MNSEIATYIGYAASVFLVLSFMLKDIKQIRFVNLVGCICFVIYGVFAFPEPSFPIIIPNVMICLVQIYYLVFFSSKS
ncbi:MAG: uroporphyrinogen decarboxylase [Bergeyella zoohelcum]|nr:uroporphyrinogen decarboxylase [Bergeyella zoohelcum]